MVQEELKKRNLPNVLVINGKEIVTKQQWENARKYWEGLLLEEEYGQKPPYLKPSVVSQENWVDFGGKAIWEDVTFTFTNNKKTHNVPTKLIYPKGKTNIPFFIYLDFYGEAPSPYFPVEEILDNGFGVFAVCYNAITQDNDDFSNGLAGLFQNGERKGNATGKIMYWAYMASQMMDYLQTLSFVNKNQVGVIGHSRLGKTALLVAALDTRFAFTCVNQSGCSGVALSRGLGKGGESIRDIYQKFPYWFCPNYAKYMDNEDELPFDQHCLMALVAPRQVYVSGATEDLWADNDSQFLSCAACSPVWKIYEKDGLISSDRLPKIGDVYMKGQVGFYLRKGTHFLGREDWLYFIKAIMEKEDRGQE